MKLKNKISLLTLGTLVSTTTSFVTISLTTHDIRTFRNFELTESDKQYYSNLYTAKNGVFDSLSVLERRQKLLNENHIREFKPSIGIIDLDVVRHLPGMNLPGVKTGIHPESRNSPGGQHATTIASMLGTRSGINPFANVYSAVLREFGTNMDATKRYWDSMFKYFSDNNVSVVNMSLGNRVFDIIEIMSNIINSIDNEVFRKTFNIAKFNDVNAPAMVYKFRSLKDQNDFANNFLSNFWNVNNQFFDFDKFLNSRFRTSRFSPNSTNIKNFKSIFVESVISELVNSYNRLSSVNQLYSDESRFMDSLILKYKIKFIVSGGNDQNMFVSLRRYVEKFKNYEFKDGRANGLKDIDINILAGWVPDALKKSRNTIYVGSINIRNDLSENYSVVGTEFHEDYPFVSTYTGFTTFNDKNSRLFGVNRYIRSYNNDRFSVRRPNFTEFHGTSYSSGLLAGLISLAEYEVGRKLSISEVKAALALTSKHSKAKEDNLTFESNPLYEYTTISKARNRTGYGIPQYDKFIEAIMNKNNIKTISISDILQGKANNIFKDIKLGVADTLEISVSWDYIPNSVYDSNTDGKKWNTKINKNRFLFWINRFTLEALDTKNQLFKSTESQNSFSNTRKLTFTNYTFDEAYLYINLYTKKFFDNMIDERFDGQLTVAWQIHK